MGEIKICNCHSLGFTSKSTLMKIHRTVKAVTMACDVPMYKIKFISPFGKDLGLLTAIIALDHFPN